MKNKEYVIDILSKEKSKLVELLPEYIKEDFQEESYIAGGSIYSLVNDKAVNDYDFFVKSLDIKLKLLTYFKGLKGCKIKQSKGQLLYIGEYKNNKLIITDNAITIGKYQIVLKDYGEPFEVVSKFDFKHNMFYFHDDKIEGFDFTILNSNELIYNDNRARDIASCIMRIPKFIEKGFTISNKELNKMMNDLLENGFTKEEIIKLKLNGGFSSGE